jgi:hypothetical protein
MFAGVELRTTDPEAASRFYEALLQRPPLRVGRLPERAAARGAPAHWLGTIRVADVEATVARMVALGGQHLVSGLARDPGGAVVAFTAEDAPPSLPVVWADLHTTDAARALAVYGELAGWRRAGTISDCHLLAAEGEPFAGVVESARLPGVHPHWAFHFPVASLDAALDTIRTQGGKLIGERTFRDHRVAHAEDPQGAEIAVSELTPA